MTRNSTLTTISASPPRPLYPNWIYPLHPDHPFDNPYNHALVAIETIPDHCWVLDCWIVDADGRQDPGYADAPTPIRVSLLDLSRGRPLSQTSRAQPDTRQLPPYAADVLTPSGDLVTRSPYAHIPTTRPAYFTETGS